MIYLYGAGILGRIIGNILSESGKEFAFIDNYHKDRSINGARVLYHNEITPTPEDEAYITVCTMPLHTNYQQKIIDEIIAIGFDHAHTLHETYIAFPSALKKFASCGSFWRSFGNKNNPIWNEKKAHNFYPLLSDKRSVDLFENIKAFRLNPITSNYIWPDIGIQYIDININNFPSYDDMHVLDLGAYTGDTLEDFIKKYGKKVKSFHCFEPDSGNYPKLCNNVKKIKTKHQIDISTYPYAVGSEDKMCQFTDSQNSTSSLSDNGTVEVRSVVLDDHLHGEKINYIKIDIEGGEFDAIVGASSLIKKYKPDMAISLYHKPDDFWVLPNKIIEFFPDCKMYLRQHHHWGLELTLYVTQA